MKKDAKMKIAIFTTDILTDNNADGLYLSEPLKHLVKYNDLEIYIFAPNDIPEDFKNYNNIKHIRYIVYKSALFRLISSFSVLPKLLKNDYDIFHCIGEKAVSITLIAQKIRRKKTPIIYERFEVEDNWEIDIKRMGGIRSYIYIIIKKIIKFRKNMVIKNSNAMTVRTEAQREHIIKSNIYKGKIFVLGPIGINLNLFGKNYKKDLELINNLELINKKVVMYTGGISSGFYGIGDLIKAMVIVNSKIVDVALVLVGDGNWLSAAKECTKKLQLNNVIFTGRVPHQQIPKYHSISDVLVIPHLKRVDSEMQFPTKLLEYLASGKPIVSTSLKSIADVVGDNAVLVEPGNPQSIAEGIIKLLDNEQLAKKMGEHGKELIYNYSWEKTAERYYEAYKFMLGRGQGSKIEMVHRFSKLFRTSAN